MVAEPICFPPRHGSSTKVPDSVTIFQHSHDLTHGKEFTFNREKAPAIKRATLVAMFLAGDESKEFGAKK